MKKLLLLVICLLFAGCTVIKENTAPVPQLSATASVSATAAASAQIKASLYFLSEDGQKFVVEIRPVALDNNGNIAEAVIKELIKGPAEPGWKKVAVHGMSLNYIEVSDDIADVYVKASAVDVSDEDRFIFESAAANTLSDLLNVNYVNVFWNGVQRGLDGTPTGPASKLNGNIEEAWAKAQTQSAPQNAENIFERKVALYFGAKDGAYILPEVRNIVFGGKDDVQAVLDQLISGPRNAFQRVALLRKDTQFTGAEVAADNGSQALILHFSVFNRVSELGDQSGELLAYASIAYTLTGILPGIESVRIDIQGQTVAAVGTRKFPNGMRRTDFKQSLGKSITLYMLYKDSTLLTAVDRTVMQSEQWDAVNRLKELFKGPKENDTEAAWPVLPAGVNEKDILDISVDKETATVDLTRNFEERCKSLSAGNELLLVYGIVNTLTEIDGVKQVRLTIDERPIEKLAGSIYLMDPLIRNPGIIKNNS
jgi:spore germination protein GerM